MIGSEKEVSGSHDSFHPRCTTAWMADVSKCALHYWRSLEDMTSLPSLLNQDTEGKQQQPVITGSQCRMIKVINLYTRRLPCPVDCNALTYFVLYATLRALICFAFNSYGNPTLVLTKAVIFPVLSHGCRHAE